MTLRLGSNAGRLSDNKGDEDIMDTIYGERARGKHKI